MGVRIHLDHLLVKKRLSLIELSDRTGLSVRDLEILRDQKALAMRLKTIELLCRALDCTPNELMTIEN